MYLIEESKNSFGNCYCLSTLDKNNKVLSNIVVQIKTFNTNVNGREITMIYDTNMKPIEEAVQFINFEMNNLSTNYKLQAITAIKLLYSYLELYKVNLVDFQKKEAKSLLDFIKGTSRDGFIYTTKLLTIRQNETVLSYLKIFRKYISSLGYDNHILLKKSDSLKTIIMPESGGAHTINTYSISVKTNTKTDYVPQYISIDEFKNITNIIDKEYSLRDRILCRLMFEHGLRLGECLGLTLEDIKFKQNNNFQIDYYVELRNRLSDSKEQKAKTAMSVSTVSDYNDKNYSRKDVGYQQIFISPNLAEELLQYINEFHNSADKNFIKRYNQFSRADSVPKGNSEIKENYYIFLNSLGRPLSENLWSKNLRNIFTKAGLIVDKGVRKNNLSHRFRHGYAMYLTNVLGLDSYAVKILMRHKNLSTTSIYHNPTPDDIAEIQRKVINTWDISILN